MPRSRRKRSGTDTYHVVSRGNNKIAILPGEKEKGRYYGLMKEKAKKYEVEIYAYCIMSNHVHILLKTEFINLPQFMKELNLEYAVYYNCKFGGTGHVFEARYYSGCVETEAYLLSCIRYIHNNPVKAHAVKKFSDYPYSSAKEYFAEEIEEKEGCISKNIYEILSKRFRNLQDFIEFHDIFDGQEIFDIAEDSEAYKQECVNIAAEKYLEENRITDRKILLEVPHIRDCFIRECSLQTGIPKLKIENILKTAGKSTCPLLSDSSDNKR